MQNTTSEMAPGDTRRASALQNLVDVARQATNADGAELCLSSQPRIVMRSVNGPSADLAWLSKGIDAQQLPARGLVDTSLMPSGQPAGVPASVASLAVVPVCGPEGETGSLALVDRMADKFDDSTLDLLDKVVDLVEDWLDRALEQGNLDELVKRLLASQEQLVLTHQQLETAIRELG